MHSSQSSPIDLKSTIVQFVQTDHLNDVPQENLPLTAVNVIHQTNELLKKAEAKSLHPIYKAMLHALCMMCYARNCAWPQMADAVDKTLSAFNAETLRHKEASLQLREIVMNYFDRTLKIAIYHLVDRMHDSFFSKLISLLLIEYSVEHERNTLFYLNDLDKNNLNEKLTYEARVLSLVEQIQFKLTHLPQEFISSYLQKSYLMHWMMCAIHRYLYSKIEVIHLDNAETRKRESIARRSRLAETIFQEAEHAIGLFPKKLDWQSTPKEQYQDMMLVLLTRSCLVTHYDKKYPELLVFHAIFNRFVNACVHPKSSPQSLEVFFQLIQLEMSDRIKKEIALDDLCVKLKTESLNRDELKQDAYVHLNYLWMMLINISFHLLDQHHAVVRVKQAKKKRGRQQSKHRDAIESLSVIDIMPLRSRASILDSLYHLDKSLEELSSTLLFMKEQNPQIKRALFAPIESAEEIFYDFAHILPTVENLRPEALRTLKNVTSDVLTEWLGTLDVLKRSYEKLAMLFECIMDHIGVFHKASILNVQFTVIKRDYILPQLTAIEIEIQSVHTQEAALVSKKTAQEKYEPGNTIIEQFIKQQEAEKDKLQQKTKKISKKKAVHPAHVMDQHEESEEESDDDAPITLKPEETEDALILNKKLEILRALQFHNYPAAASLYQNLRDYPSQYEKALDGELVCYSKMLSDELDECLKLLTRIKIRASEIDFEKAETCYPVIDALKAQYEKVFSDYTIQIQARKQETQTHSSAEPSTENNPANVRFLERCRTELNERFTKCQKEKTILMEKYIKRKIMLIIRSGLDDQHITDFNQREQFINMAYAHYILNNNQNKTKNFNKCQTIYQIGVQKIREQSKLKFEKTGTHSAITRHMNLLKKYPNAFTLPKGVEQEAPRPDLPEVPASTSAPVGTILSTASDSAVSNATEPLLLNHPDDILKRFCTSQAMTEEDLLAVEKWVQHNKQLLSSSNIVFSPKLAFQCLSKQWISADLEKNYHTLDRIGLLDALLPFGNEFHQSRKAAQARISEQLKLIGEKIKTERRINLKNDLIIAQILTVIVFESLPPNILSHYLSFWVDQTLPLRRLINQFNLSSACEDALHTYLTTALAEFSQSQMPVTPQNNDYIEKMRLSAFQHNIELLKTKNLKDKPISVFKYGSSTLLLPNALGEPPLIASKHKPNDVDVRTSALKIPFACKRSRHVEGLHHPLIDNDVDHSCSIMVSQTTISKQKFDITLHGILWDVIGNRFTYCHEQAYDDLKNGVLRLAQPFENIQTERQLLIRILIDAVNYDTFQINEENQIRLFAENELQNARQKKMTFMPKVLEHSAQLGHFLLTRFTTGEALEHLNKARRLNLLEYLFPIPIQALPFSDIAFSKLEIELQKLELKHYDNQFEKLSLIILTVLYYSCESLPNRKNEFVKACQYSIKTLYSHSLLLKSEIERNKDLFVTRMETEQTVRLSTSKDVMYPPVLQENIEPRAEFSANPAKQ